MNKSLAFIGLGVMGFPLAGHLQNAGHKVTVFNRTAEKARLWKERYGGASGSTPRQAAIGAEMVFVCVGNDDDVREVCLSKEGALSGMSAGSLLIDHTTASAHLAEELANECAKQEIGFMDAPISGGQAGAENGQLTVMLGGSEDDYKRVEPVLTAYAKSTQLIGPVGHGQKAKMVNQICIAGLIQALAEGLHFGQQAGLDVHKVVAAIRNGAAQSWQMENRFETMLSDEFEFGFAVDWMRKDLDIALSAAQDLQVELPVTKLVDQYYGEVQAMGGGRWDGSSLITRFTRNKG